MPDVDLNKRLEFAALVGVSVALLDVAFHEALVRPLETPEYYVAKFVFAFFVVLGFAGFSLTVGSLVGGAVFTATISLWYYFGYLIDNAGISACVTAPGYNCTISGIPRASLFLFGTYPVTPVTLIEGFVHFLWFAIAFVFWGLMISD